MQNPSSLPSCDPWNHSPIVCHPISAIRYDRRDSRCPVHVLPAACVRCPHLTSGCRRKKHPVCAVVLVLLVVRFVSTLTCPLNNGLSYTTSPACLLCLKYPHRWSDAQGSHFKSSGRPPKILSRLTHRLGSPPLKKPDNAVVPIRFTLAFSMFFVLVLVSLGISACNF